MSGRLESIAWYRLERCAVWVLAHSHAHITGEYRLSRVLHAVKHSEAYKRGAVVTTPRAWLSTSERN